MSRAPDAVLGFQAVLPGQGHRGGVQPPALLPFQLQNKYLARETQKLTHSERKVLKKVAVGKFSEGSFECSLLEMAKPAVSCEILACISSVIGSGITSCLSITGAWTQH